MLALLAPFAHLRMGREYPVHRAPMAQIGTLIEQGGIHLTRGTIHETLTIQHSPHFGPFFNG
jgi:hypothetical protein